MEVMATVAGEMTDIYNGGSAGSDGEGSDGGKGSGEDVTTYDLTSWTLSPGDGG